MYVNIVQCFHSAILHRICMYVCLFLAQQPPLGQGLLIHEVSRSHITMHHIR